MGRTTHHNVYILAATTFNTVTRFNKPIFRHLSQHYFTHFFSLDPHRLVVCSFFSSHSSNDFLSFDLHHGPGALLASFWDTLVRFDSVMPVFGFSSFDISLSLARSRLGSAFGFIRFSGITHLGLFFFTTNEECKVDSYLFACVRSARMVEGRT